LERRPAAIRKSDLTPAFEAAKAAGFDHVSVVCETPHGQRFLITAGCGSNAEKPDMTPFEKWKADRDAD
jgi:hypothetical protein